MRKYITTVALHDNPILSSRSCSNSIERRFWSKVVKGDGCWIWTGATSGHGYGILWRGMEASDYIHAHVLSWLIHNGDFDGDFVFHSCPNRLCCAPSHLYIETSASSQTLFQKRFWEKVTKTDACWLWNGYRNACGYGCAGIGGRKTMLAHRAAWEMVNGPVPAGMRVLHTCDIPACVRVDHLWIGTQQENIADMIAKGRMARGEQRSRKLTAQQVTEIRYARTSGMFLSELAKKYRIGYGTVHAIISRRTWNHI